MVYGAGGIGGVIGARLHQYGHDVILIARGRHFEAIRDYGLRFQSPEDDHTLEIPVADHPDGVEWRDDDVVLMAMKSQDTHDALVALAAAAPPSISVVSTQNGVANEPAAIRFFATVYGMCVMCPTNHTTPGIVQAYSAPVSGILDVGRFEQDVDETAVAIAAALSNSTFVSVPRPDIMRWKFGKLLMNLGNGIDALCGPAARGTDLFGIVRDEGVAALRAANIPFVDAQEDAERRGDIMTLRPIAGERRGGGSTWQSLARGLSSVETDYLNGEIVKIGRLHGVPTPANELMQKLTARAARDGTEAGSVSPDDLIAELSASV